MQWAVAALTAAVLGLAAAEERTGASQAHAIAAAEERTDTPQVHALPAAEERTDTPHVHALPAAAEGRTDTSQVHALTPAEERRGPSQVHAVAEERRAAAAHDPVVAGVEAAVLAARNPEHIGTWRCVLSGNPAWGEERMLLRFDSDGEVGIARASETAFRAWEPASRWREARGRLSFADRRTGREFEGGLRGSALGGTWQSRTLFGSWWCSEASAEEQAAVPAPGVDPLLPTVRMPSLFPVVSFMPIYPRQAIREAKEGRAVVCFLVDASGNVLEPEVIELSDEIFRAPSLDSLARSRYRGWEDASILRPACRTLVYRLDTTD